MPRVDNLIAQGITVLRWRSLPHSNVWVDPQGRRMTDVPAHIAYSDVTKSLHEQGCLRIEGYYPASQVKAFIASTKVPIKEVVVVPPPHELPASGTVVRELRRDKRPRRQER